MRRFFSRYKLTIALIVFVLVGFSFLLAALYFNAIINRNQDAIIKSISSYAKDEMGVQIEIGSLNAEFPFSLSIHTLSMKDMDDQLLLTIDKSIIKADWLNMILNPDDFLASLRYIELINPLVVVAVTDGELNWMRLIDEEVEEPAVIDWERIDLNLVISGCAIQTNLIGNANEDQPVDIPWRIPLSINANFLLADGKLVLHPRLRAFWTNNNLVNLKNTNKHEPVIQIRGVGDVAGDIILNGQISIDNFNNLFNSAKPFIKELNNWDVDLNNLNGKFDLKLANLAGGNPEIEFDLEMNTRDFIIDTPQRYLEQIHFAEMSIRCSPNQNVFQIQFDSTSGDMAMTGIMHVLDISTGNFKGTAHVRDIPSDYILDRRINDVPLLEGSFDVDVHFSGDFQSPVIYGEILPGEMTIANSNYSMDRSDILFKDNSFSMQGLTFTDKDGGKLTINGCGCPFDNKYLFNIKGVELDTNKLPRSFNVNLNLSDAGKLNFVSSIEVDKAFFLAQVDLDIGHGSMMGLDYSHITGILKINSEHIHFDEIIVNPSAGGLIHLNGDVKFPDVLDLNLEFAEIKFPEQSISDNNQVRDLSGTFFGNASVTGPISNPEGEFSLRTYDGKIGDYAFEKVEFNAEINPKGIETFEARLIATGSEIEFNAEYLYDHNQPLTVWGVWRNVPITAFSDQSMNQSVMISGSGSFTGDFDDLNGVLKIALDGDDGFGNQIHTAYNPVTLNLFDPFDYSGSEDPDNSVFFGWFLDIDFTGLSKFSSIDELISQLGEALEFMTPAGFISRGKLDLTGGVRFDSFATESDSLRLLTTLSRDVLPHISGIELDIPEISKPVEHKLPLDGLLALNLNIERDIDGWDFQGKAEGIDFEINTEKINLLQAEMSTLPDDKLDIALAFSQGEGRMSVAGQLDFQALIGTAPFELDVRVDSYPVNSLVNLSGYRPEDDLFEGFLDGSGKLTGSITEPRLEEINLAILSARLFGIELENSFINFSLSGTRIDIERFELSDGDEFFAVAVGVLELDPTKISGNRVNVLVNNLMLEKLSIPDVLPDGLAGNLNLISLLEYNPNTLDPQIVIDLEIAKPSFKNIGLDKITGEAVIDGKTGTVYLGDFSGNIGDASIKMGGTIQPRLTQRDILLDLNMETHDYDISPIIAQMGLPLEGDDISFSMNFDIGGTVSNPSIDGSLIAGITSPIYNNMAIAEAISINANISDNVLNLDGRLTHGDSALIARGTFDIFDFYNTASDENGITPKSPSLTITNLDNKPFPIKNFGLDVNVITSGKDDKENMILALGRGSMRLSGIIKIVSGVYRVAPIPLTPGDRQASPIELDLIVEIFDGFPVSSGNIIDISLEKSSLKIAGTLSFPTADGEIVVKDGHLRLIDRSFVITRAQLQFREFMSIDNPYLMGEATTTIISRSIRDFRGAESIEVTARIDARLRQLSTGIRFTSDKGTFTEDELMGIILKQDIFEGFQDEGILETLAAQALTLPGAYLSRYFETRGGFQVFQIGIDFEDNVYVYMQYETFDDLFLDHYQLFDAGSPEFNSFLKYRYRPDSYVGLGTDEKGSVIFKVDFIVPIR